MSTPRRQAPPPWLDLSTPQSDRARVQRCPRCRRPVLRALVGNPCGVDVRADPTPLDIRAELAARLAGAWTYCLRLHAYLPPRLTYRDRWHIAGGKCTHTVVGDHDCPARGSPTPAPITPPDPTRLF